MTTLHLSDCLNYASQVGVDEAVVAFSLPASAAPLLNDWLQAQENVLELEDRAHLAARIADQIVDERLAPIFNAAMEGA
jgi:hypothetical protein